MRKEFATQHPEFICNPLSELREAIVFAKSNPLIETMYNKFIKAMVYDQNPPSFNESMDSFATNLEKLLPKGNGLSFSELARKANSTEVKRYENRSHED